VAAVISSSGRRPGAIFLQAYDPDVLAAAGKLLPGVPTFWTVDMQRDGSPYPPELALAADERGFHGLALDYRGVTELLMDAMVGLDLALDVWTINEVGPLRDWLSKGVYVETDHPELAAR
jgi:hypothetical protein